MATVIGLSNVRGRGVAAPLTIDARLPGIGLRRVWPGKGDHAAATGGPPLAPTRPTAPGMRRARFVRRSEPYLLIAAACALMALLATLYLTEDNQAAVMTYQINDLQNQQSALLRTQGDLKLQLDQLESLQRVQNVADAMGMVPVQPTAALYVDLPPAVETVAAPAALAQAQR